MIFHELHNRYGSRLAGRLQQQLTDVELQRVSLRKLLPYLSHRAEDALKQYQAILDNPFISEELGAPRDVFISTLYRRWKDAEELAYLVTIAEDVNAQARASTGK